MPRNGELLLGCCEGEHGVLLRMKASCVCCGRGEVGWSVGDGGEDEGRRRRLRRQKASAGVGNGPYDRGMAAEWKKKTAGGNGLSTLLHLRLPLEGGTATRKAEVELPTGHYQKMEKK